MSPNVKEFITILASIFKIIISIVCDVAGCIFVFRAQYKLALLCFIYSEVIYLKESAKCLKK